MSGAIGLVLLSRVLGIFRETIVIGRVGVHDYTDVYFGLSTIVLWLQNWAFGAYSLYFVPKYLGMNGESRNAWYKAQLRRGVAFGVGGAAAFLIALHPIEALVVPGRGSLGAVGSIALALCVPITLASGMINARTISSPRGILLAARSQVFANVLGIASLVAMTLVPVARASVLPIALLTTYASLLALLLRTHRELDRAKSDSAVTSTLRRTVSGDQAVATTVENVGFNLDAIAQQAIAGRLASGAVTLNAYAMRFVLIPAIGLLQPVQQRLLIKFSDGKQSDSLAALSVAVKSSLAASVLLGVAAGALLQLSMPLWHHEWQQRLGDYRMPTVLLFYGIYAGIVFSNQTVARYAFAANRGWEYTWITLLAYGAGNLVKLGLLPRFHLVALPLGSLATEGVALIILFARCRRPQLSALAASEVTG